MNTKQLNNLFLQQSYLDAYTDYERSLDKPSFIKWDYVVITASNNEQVDLYCAQIDYRLQHNLLPKETHYVVLPDPDGKRVGSGGATFNVLKYIADNDSANAINHFDNKRILVLHSGGDSKRVPQYSACGKLFSPVPHELPDGRASTLFDEFIISMSGLPSRMPKGMLVLSGDVLLLFNPLQIDFQYNGAAAISIKEPVEIGKEHGVFLNDGNDFVGSFLHKQSEKRLRELGAVNQKGFVDLDTGAIIFDPDLLQTLFSLISTDNRVDTQKFSEFVNEEARISFYGDFLYPLAVNSTLDSYYEETAEYKKNEKLHECRTKLWNALSRFSLRLLCPSPAEFIHFGTTQELLSLVTETVCDYEFLGWKKQVGVNTGGQGDFAAHNAYLGAQVIAEPGTYLENSYLLGECHVQKGSIVSGLRLQDETIPPHTVLHGVKLNDDNYVVRAYGVTDDSKGKLKTNATLFGIPLSEFLSKNHLSTMDIWDNDEDYLWFARLYPVCKTQQEAIKFALILCKMAEGVAVDTEIQAWKSMMRVSLCTSFNQADGLAIERWQHTLKTCILASKFIAALESGMYYRDAFELLGNAGLTEEVFNELIQSAENAGFSLKIRIYYAISRFLYRNDVSFENIRSDDIWNRCFEEIQKYVSNGTKCTISCAEHIIQKEHVFVSLPVRVNWAGGWTDTPPYCNEHGGVVINAAIKLRGILPVQITVRRLPKYHIELESTDVGAHCIITSASDIQDCDNPYDSFALHKAALVACGVIPAAGKVDLEAVLRKMGGGIYLSTQVIDVPKGSGLGTSSILSGACVKGLFEIFDIAIADTEIYNIVLYMEQIMSTGGGWQDQVGGISSGIKFITTKAGQRQQIHVQQLQLSDDTKVELQNRFALIYTGQRRLARNLLRDIIGGYIGARQDSLTALDKMQKVAALMRFELEQGNMDEFARLLNEHWELSKQLDHGTTNTCIDQIVLTCKDLIDGVFIAGAGGGGFLQVILKQGQTKENLRNRLHEVFQDSGVDVWDSEFYYG